MYEVEVKVRADHETVRGALADLGAESAGTVAQTDTYLDAPHRDFAATDEALRIRRETADGEETVAVTYKGPLVEAASKTREEHETAVADGEATREIFESLGFRPAATVRKERERFTVGEFTVSLDDVTDLGEFVEVETAVRSEDEVAERREVAYDLLRDLGLDPDEQVRTAYLGLLLEDSPE
ncbi:MAG: class IV adenylate cyclase [Halorientalis sp.]